MSTFEPSTAVQDAILELLQRSPMDRDQILRELKLPAYIVTGAIKSLHKDHRKIHITEYKARSDRFLPIYAYGYCMDIAKIKLPPVQDDSTAYIPQRNEFETLFHGPAKPLKHASNNVVRHLIKINDGT